MNVIEFLLARYAEEEAAARAAQEGPWDIEETDNELRSAQPHRGEIGYIYLQTDRAFIAMHDPTAVLADVEAKRRVVAAIEEHRENEWDGDPIHERVLYALASAYSTHPDYSQRWKP